MMWGWFNLLIDSFEGGSHLYSYYPLKPVCNFVSFPCNQNDSLPSAFQNVTPWRLLYTGP